MHDGVGVLGVPGGLRGGVRVGVVEHLVGQLDVLWDGGAGGTGGFVPRVVDGVDAGLVHRARDALDVFHLEIARAERRFEFAGVGVQAVPVFNRVEQADELVDAQQFATADHREPGFGEHLAGGLLERHLVPVQGDKSSVRDDLDERTGPGSLCIRNAVPAEDHEREERAVGGLDLELLELREGTVGQRGGDRSGLAVRGGSDNRAGVVGLIRVDSHYAVGGGLGLLAELDHHEGHGGVDADERDDEEDETDDHLAHALLGFLGVLVHLRGAHELLGIYGPVAVGVENLERGLDLGGEGRDGHGTLVVGLAQHRVGADHRLEFVHVEDAVAVRVEVFEHALNVRGEGADVDPPSPVIRSALALAADVKRNIARVREALTR